MNESTKLGGTKGLVWHTRLDRIKQDERAKSEVRRESLATLKVPGVVCGRNCRIQIGQIIALGWVYRLQLDLSLDQVGAKISSVTHWICPLPDEATDDSQ